MPDLVNVHLTALCAADLVNVYFEMLRAGNLVSAHLAALRAADLVNVHLAALRAADLVNVRLARARISPRKKVLFKGESYFTLVSTNRYDPKDVCKYSSCVLKSKKTFFIFT